MSLEGSATNAQQIDSLPQNPYCNRLQHNADGWSDHALRRTHPRLTRSRSGLRSLSPDRSLSLGISRRDVRRLSRYHSLGVVSGQVISYFILLNPRFYCGYQDLALFFCMKGVITLFTFARTQFISGRYCFFLGVEPFLSDGAG